jgi:hypothetical protein
MNKKILWFLPVFLLVSVACSVSVNPQGFNSNQVRGSGVVKTETRDVSNFSKVDLNGSGDLTITVGDKEALTIEAEDNILPLLTSEVRGDTLVLSMKPGSSVNPTRPIRYNLTVKNLTSASLLGSGSISGSGLSADSFSASLIGSGNINLEKANFKTLNANIAGSGNMAIDGTADSQTVTIPGSGEYRAQDLKSQSAHVTIAGSGTTTVWASQSLDANILGSGTIKYYDSPTVSQKITGSGTVQSLGSK